LEEIRGLAEGANLPFDDALLMSTYNSVLFATGNGTPWAGRIVCDQMNGCSGVAFADSPVGPFVFKTYDPTGKPEINSPARRLEKGEQENWLIYVLHAEYKDGPKVIGVRLAGSIWTETGINADGFAFASASLHPKLYPQQAAGLPQHFLGTMVLSHCRSTAEARALLPKVPVFGKGYAMVLNDVYGHCVGVEKTGNYTGFNPPSLGIAYQTNHLRSEALSQIGFEQDPGFWNSGTSPSKGYFRNSHNRVRHLERQLPALAAETDFDVLLSKLFHAGAPGDLIQTCIEACQYWITTWAALAFPEKKEMWVTQGLPEECQFEVFKL